MIRIGMGAPALANTRFVVSPLSTLLTGLLFAYCRVQDDALLLCYPAHPAAAAELLGSSRARILENLSTPRTTSELAHRHWLTPSTVSHCLGALHRAGLVDKVRVRQQVFYRRTDRGRSLAAADSGRSGRAAP